MPACSPHASHAAGSTNSLTCHVALPPSTLAWRTCSSSAFRQCLRFCRINAGLGRREEAIGDALDKLLARGVFRGAREAGELGRHVSRNGLLADATEHALVEELHLPAVPELRRAAHLLDLVHDHVEEVGVVRAAQLAPLHSAADDERKRFRLGRLVPAREQAACLRSGRAASTTCSYCRRVERRASTARPCAARAARRDANSFTQPKKVLNKRARLPPTGSAAGPPSRSQHTH